MTKSKIIYFFILTFISIFLISSVSAVKIGTTDGVGVKIQNAIVTGVSSFIALNDTPNSYAGSTGKCVAVNSSETGLEFIACGVGGGGDFSFTDFQNSFNLNISVLNFGDFSFTDFQDSFWSNITDFNSTLIPSTSYWTLLDGSLVPTDTNYNVTMYGNVFIGNNTQPTNWSNVNIYDVRNSIPASQTAEVYIRTDINSSIDYNSADYGLLVHNVLPTSELGDNLVGDQVGIGGYNYKYSPSYTDELYGVQGIMTIEDGSWAVASSLYGRIFLLGDSNGTNIRSLYIAPTNTPTWTGDVTGQFNQAEIGSNIVSHSISAINTQLLIQPATNGSKNYGIRQIKGLNRTMTNLFESPILIGGSDEQLENSNNLLQVEGNTFMNGELSVGANQTINEAKVYIANIKNSPTLDVSNVFINSTESSSTEAYYNYPTYNLGVYRLTNGEIVYEGDNMRSWSDVNVYSFIQNEVTLNQQSYLGQAFRGLIIDNSVGYGSSTLYGSTYQFNANSNNLRSESVKGTSSYLSDFNIDGGLATGNEVLFYGANTSTAIGTNNYIIPYRKNGIVYGTKTDIISYSYIGGDEIGSIYGSYVLTGGNATNTYGYYYWNNKEGDEPVNSIYGLYISREDKNYLSGNTGIGTTTPLYPLTVASNSSGISIWSSANVSASGYITRTSVYDSTKGSALDWIKDSKDYLITNAKGDEVIDHSKFYGSTTYEGTDYSKPTIKEVCQNITTEVDPITREPIKQILTCADEVQYNEKITESGVNLGDQLAMQEQAIYELKTELCKKDPTYKFCLPVSP